MAENHKNRPNPASLAPRTTRRRFSHSEKLRIVAIAHGFHCPHPTQSFQRSAVA